LKKIFLHTISAVLLVSLFFGCSTEKNTRTTRTFHNITSHYNIYFNAKESVKEGLTNIEERTENDYTRLLPIYITSAPAAAKMVKSDMDYAVLKCSKLIEIHSITKKPKRKKGGGSRKYQEFASQEEFNKWIDDSFLLMGEAYFYEQNYFAAINNLSYVVRKYPKEETADEAQIFLIRCYTELDRFIEANGVIQALQGYDDFPKRLEAELAKATAFYYMKQGEYSNTIKMLEIAIKKTFWKKDKARLQYIIAQLYQEMGDNAKASAAYEAVTKLNPEYSMAFNAKINAMGAFSDNSNAEELRKSLNKMLKDKRNVEFRDQIYYALGNIDFREGNRQQATENYRKSVASSYNNQFQRAKSAITLADIYFEDLNYRGAQSYYDSAMVIIGEDYPDYKNLHKRYKSLSNLVDNLLIVERQDSLQKVAQMPEKEREALIARLMKEEQERQQQMDMSAQNNTQGYSRSTSSRLSSSSSSSTWYFYNSQTISYGQTSFQRTWGKRTLEDDWRRSNKSIVTEYNDEVAEEQEDEEQKETDPLKKEYYTQDLPLTDSLMQASHDKIRDALYNAGRLFKVDFEDYPRSAEEFEELNKRYPTNIYLLSAYFELYDLYELIGDTEKSEYYKNLITTNYPESKYAQYLINPNFFVENEKHKNEFNDTYNKTFQSYKAGRYRDVIALTSKMKQMKPDSVVMPKIDFMEAIAKGTQTNVHDFEKQLKAYLEKYPAKEPSALAKEILTLIQDSTLADYEKLVEMGYLNDEIQNEELLPDNYKSEDEFGGKFTYEEDLLHYFVIAYPRKDEAKIDLNRLKFDIANYNIDHYTKVDYDIETDYLNDKFAFVVVRSMTNKENALIYHGAIIRKAAAFRTLKGIDYYNFVISSTNYRAIKEEHSMADYLKFFVKNYSRYIHSNFKDDDDISPEELMARAAAENDALKEKGRYVEVNTKKEELYNSEIDTTQNLVLAVKDKGMSLRTLSKGFADFNKDEFRAWNLALKIKDAGEYQLLVISGIPSLNESMSYFRKVVTARKLFAPLGQATYRNFLITDENLQTMIDKKKVDEYISFFRSNYIQRKKTTSGTSTSSSTSSNSVNGTTGTTSTNTTSSVDAAADSPYSKNIEEAHYVVFAIPADGVNSEAFINGIKAYNKSNYADLNLTVEKQDLDFRSLVVIKGLNDKETARKYFGVLVQNRDLYAPLGNAQYRNFLITEDNYKVFRQEKNIKEYMDFYKQIYLGR
jgi:tetratricopeptide (TPR) repeat protein